MNTIVKRISAVMLGLMLSVVAFAGLETGTYISDLVVTNPTSSDLASQGDDHLRLVKSTIKTTFPNITGAVTPTHTELNFVDGVTSAIQTQIDAKAATSHTHATADVTSGTFADARISASSVTQHANATAAAISAGTAVAIVTRNVTGKAGTTKTLSTSAASGGSDGDIWYRY
jgi:hypothetical protein